MDITDRKRAEELSVINYNALYETTQQLEQSRNMLQLIIESIPVRVFWKDNDSRFMGCNTLFARDAGLSRPEQLMGKDDFAMGWREQAEGYRADDRQVMESRRPKMNIVEPQTTPTGAKIWLNTSKVPLQKPNGEVFGVLGVYEDITPRYQAEETLRHSETRFRGLFDNMGNAVAIYQAVEEGGDFVFLDVNCALEKIEQVCKEDQVGRRVTQAFPGVKDFGLFEVLQRVWRTGTAEHLPVAFTRTSGSAAGGITMSTNFPPGKWWRCTTTSRNGCRRKRPCGRAKNGTGPFYRRPWTDSGGWTCKAVCWKSMRPIAG